MKIFILSVLFFAVLVTGFFVYFTGGGFLNYIASATLCLVFAFLAIASISDFVDEEPVGREYARREEMKEKRAAIRARIARMVARVDVMSWHVQKMRNFVHS